MKTIWLAGAALSALVASTTTGDTLDLVRSTLTHNFAVQSDPEDNMQPVEKSGFYLRPNVGVNLLLNVGVETGPFNDTMKFNPGVDFSFALGYQVMEWIGVELETGLAWNEARDLPLNDMSVNLYQVPIIANVNFTIPLSVAGSERWPFIGVTTYLDFNVGLGAMWTQTDFKSGPLTINSKQKDWSFTYQFGTNLRFGLSHHVDLGVYFNFRGVTKFTMWEPSPLISVDGKALYNFALGMSCRVSF